MTDYASVSIFRSALISSAFTTIFKYYPEKKWSEIDSHIFSFALILLLKTDAVL
jgi:hypothetical protein